MSGAGGAAPGVGGPRGSGGGDDGGAGPGGGAGRGPDTAGRPLFVREAIAVFRGQKALAEGAMAQLEDAELDCAPGEGANSVAVIVRHLAGNMRSRWTDFLTTDGEKPDRDRDGEFDQATRWTHEQVTSTWEGGWAITFAALDAR